MTTTYDNLQPRTFLAALDIDGTIAPSGTVDVAKAVRDAVADARAAGHHVVLSSGRSLLGVLPVASVLGLTDGWIVASNGAVTARLDPQAPEGYHLHHVLTFDAQPVVRLARSAFPGVRIAAERVGHGYDVTRLFSPQQLNGAQKVVDVAKVTERLTTRLILHAPGLLDQIDEFRATGVTVNPDGADWLDITPPRLSKATALEYVRARLKVDPAHTIAVGDGVNDVEMLTWAERGVAMGDSPAEVCAAADEVADTLAGNGAATVLRSLLPETIPAAP